MLVTELITLLKSQERLYLPAYFQQMAPYNTAHKIHGLVKVFLWPENDLRSDRLLNEDRLKAREDWFKKQNKPVDIHEFKPAYLFDHHACDENYVGGKPALTGRGLLKVLENCEPGFEIYRPYISDDRYGSINSVGIYQTNEERNTGYYTKISTRVGNPETWREILVVE